MHAGFNLEHFNTGLHNPRRPPTREEFTVDTTVEVESLRLERLLSQPLLPRQSLAQSPQQPFSVSR